ncbi:hypothetical protein BAUCODRAFT_118471 [Baudoinia panamericana UAMH 10762]|uniref:Solute carrier family 40 member n=1 Tax=Baudoinia panamericana (strain UAMH 10762) TaxID=717646 RepID=M2MUV9_BAUPA|nr:uncharacterized protein BAUCODRAFT_118471 [Baudoinia panamericana UAMH 10762]EMD00732.1 hypothetical protein BAUCODRAFT_118471 [Baudoinia panamericana UAMH 10762]
MVDSQEEHLLDELHRSDSGSSTPAERSATSLVSDTTIRRLLYTSHFLSTWNARLFEFAAYLFLAETYPHTLLPASVYALARAAAAAIISPLLGQYVDSGERLSVIRWSIVSQRLAVGSSCLLLFAITLAPILQRDWLFFPLVLPVLCLLAAIEKLGFVLNTIAIERDWVVVIAGKDESYLRTANSQMRRIDLFCKLVGPLVISIVDAASPQAAILITGGLTVLSVAIEYVSIARVHKAVPALRAIRAREHLLQDAPQPRRSFSTASSTYMSGTLSYFRHPAFLPSFSLALLYLTVLSFSGQMITYLLSLGLSPWLVGLLRGIAAVFELSATWLAPALMHHIGAIRTGIWFINFEVLCVTIACLFFWLGPQTMVATCGIVAAVMASRVGLWGFDLSAQIIIQDEVEPEARGTFSSQEAGYQNIFEMLAFASTIVYTKPEQFKIPATISAGAVALAGALYTILVRQRRGHLIHLSECMDAQKRKQAGRRGVAGFEMVPQDSATIPA